jgi:hypothetical protein
MNELENDISASQESEQRDELLRLQQDLADLEQAWHTSELSPNADHIVAQLESLQQKIDSNSALYHEVQRQLDELRAQEIQATEEKQSVEHVQTNPWASSQNPPGPMGHPPSEGGDIKALEQQAAATKQILATDYEHQVTDIRSENKRLPQDWFSQKILQPTVGKLLQRMSMYIKTNGR